MKRSPRPRKIANLPQSTRRQLNMHSLAANLRDDYKPIIAGNTSVVAFGAKGASVRFHRPNVQVTN